jgi:3-carboxy-cis,cis-muconate cycloisomerase
LIALIDAVKVSMGNEQAVRWIHHGATSQDAIDTGRMIQARAALDILDLRLTAIAVRVRELIVTHRDQPQMGRTFLQDARPTTFGFRLSTWLEPILGHVEDLRYQQSRLAIQLGGAVGTRGIFGDAAADVASALAGRLDLRLPTISWHTDRSGILALAQSLERTARTMAKIGSDVALLASSAIREVSVRTGGSSSMSGKRNPIDSVRAIAAASACSGALSMLTSAPAHELDRATGSWHVEWVALPLAFQTADAAIAAIEDCLASLDVDSERMSSQVGEDGLDGLTDAAGHQIDGVLANFDSVIRP